MTGSFKLTELSKAQLMIKKLHTEQGSKTMIFPRRRNQLIPTGTQFPPSSLWVLLVVGRVALLIRSCARIVIRIILHQILGEAQLVLQNKSYRIPSHATIVMTARPHIDAMGIGDIECGVTDLIAGLGEVLDNSQVS
jgi:hypothetical protein